MVKEKEWFKAIREGHVNVITTFLNALKDRKPERIRNLVKQLHSVDGTQSTALHLSCQYKHDVLVRILLQNGANPNILDQSGCTALHLAAWNGNDQICELLVQLSQFPIDCDIKNAAGETAMHLAAQHGHEKVVKILLGMEANMDITNNFDQTPLMLACLYGRIPVVGALVDHLDTVTKETTNYRSIEESPMHIATHNGHAQVVELLIEKGFPVNVQTAGGTCLHEAVVWNRIQVVEMLLKHHIDETIRNSDGKTALDLLDKNNQKFGLVMKEKIIAYTKKKLTDAAEEVSSVRLKEDHPDYVPAQLLSRRGLLCQHCSGLIVSRIRTRSAYVTTDGIESNELVYNAAGKIVDVLVSDDADISTKTKQSEKQSTSQPTTPEMMRRQSSKFRKEFENICFGDSDAEDDVFSTTAQSDT